jgi:hypothetical protein
VRHGGDAADRTYAAWSIAVAVAVGLVAYVMGPSASAARLRDHGRSLWTTVTRAATTGRREDRVVAWMRAHRTTLLVGGAAVGLALLWAGNLSWLGFAVVLAGVAAFELAVQRVTASPSP